MKCEVCKQEFESTHITCDEEHCHTDGKYYADCSWSANYTCPYCGHNNSPRVRMGNGKQQ